MLKLRCVKQLALCVQVLQDMRVRILHKGPSVRSVLCHFTLAVHKLYKGQIVPAAYLSVILTKCRCDMDDTSTVSHSDIGITGNEMSLFLLLCCYLCGTGK